MAVFDAMVAAVGGCTENDPPSAKGWDGWRFGVRRWREIKRSQGWEKNDAENISTVVHPELEFRIAVANTDEATGLIVGEPRSRSAKGDGSKRAVELNKSPPLPLPGFREEFDRQLRAAAAASCHIWYFCAYIEGDVRRLELSKPTSIMGGHFCGWEERIILIDDNGPVCGRSNLGDDDFGPDVEVIVRRKG
ncbi:MAG: hypothetical protein ABIQ43_09070 [Sphingomonas sp.]